MLSSRFVGLPEYPFPRLRALLGDVAPGGAEIAMSVGEPQHPIPDFVPQIMARHSASYNKYPPNEGVPELRAAISAWLGRRYGAALDPDTQITTLNGTREGLFMAALALTPPEKNGERPAILLPNPFYQCYAGAALAAGAEPIFVTAGPETGHLPDFSALPDSVLRRTALAYICSPANPQGAAMTAAGWAAALGLAERHDFVIFADECYSEIYFGAPPAGALEAVKATGADPDRLLAFHSLSKRSNLAGLRSGFAAGGVGLVGALKALRAYGGAPLPIPAQHAAAAVWGDEAHVVENRALYAAKVDMADAVLGGMPGYARPEAGFFLWLRVGDGEGFAKRLWARRGVRTLPGAYLAHADAHGVNPGAPYLRVALCAPLEVCREGLTAIRDEMAEGGGV